MSDYDWETCLIATDEWTRMIESRNDEGWEMVSVAVPSGQTPVVAYVFWKRSREKSAENTAGG